MVGAWFDLHRHVAERRQVREQPLVVVRARRLRGLDREDQRIVARRDEFEAMVMQAGEDISRLLGFLDPYPPP